MIAQIFLNCLRRGYLRLTDFSFVVFDECHHCQGNHPYACIMREFYFDQPPLPPSLQLQRQEEREVKPRPPVIMGLTASPIDVTKFDKSKLVKEIRALCENLDSRFTAYDTSEIKDSTSIKIIAIEERPDREMVPHLIEHFVRFMDHRESYAKLAKNFPQYFECVREVIEYLASKHRTLSL
jgi:superfamily II DNA or RNA helicase